MWGQQNVRRHQSLKRVHQPPWKPSARSFGLIHIQPVPNRICFPSPRSSSPCSISAWRRGSLMGNRGKGRLVTNAGKSETSETNSGFGRFGEVHVRMYSPSLSSNVAFARGISGKTSSSNVRDSSTLVTAAEGEGRGDVEGAVLVLTLSRNGSLDARVRFK